MMRRKKTGSEKEMVDQQEFAIWLGRAMSTNEVTLRVVVQMLDMISLQQKTVQALVDHLAENGNSSQFKEIQNEFEQAGSAEILEQLEDVRKELEPVLKVVDKACQQLKRKIQP
jgi:hypothetical protein